MVIEYLQASHAKTGFGIFEIDVHRVVRHRDHPEHVVHVDMHVEVVDLFGEVGRSDWTGIQVESNKGKGAFMKAAVRADELTLAKAHVRPEGELRGCACCVCSCSCAMDVRQSDEPVEIGNLRRIVDICQRYGRIERVMVNENS